MASTSTSGDTTPRWESVAAQLQVLAVGPTTAQVRIADAVGAALAANVPAPVAAVVLRAHLADALMHPIASGAEIPESLTDLERELEVTASASLFTDSREEVSAWFAARYMLMTSRGLTTLKPQVGDIVSSHAWSGEKRVISSIGSDGRIHMKGRPTRRSWPNHLEIVERVDSPGYVSAAQEVDAALRNNGMYGSTSLTRFEGLAEYALPTNVPEPEAVRALEELLESGERLEEPFQRLITQYPRLLSSIVIGGWKTYVIPKQKLGTEHATDFLVLGINSAGPHWVAVELEAPRHSIHIKNGSLAEPTRHAVKQIQDWRDWLTTNIAYADQQHGLHGLTNKVAGLVIIGRDDPTFDRVPARADSAEQARIEVHSWDWLLRQVRNVMSNPIHVSGFALDSIRLDAGASTTPAPKHWVEDLEDQFPAVGRDSTF